MNLQNQTYSGLLCLLFTLVQLTLSAQVTIIESQTFNRLHRMDIRWEAAATELGLNASILPQTALTDLSNFSNSKVLVISSGVIGLDNNQLLTLERFVKNGGNLYIQGEYLMGAQGNHTFEYLVSKIGGSFLWNGETNGQLSPLVLNPIISQQDSLRYFWYGAHGSGDANAIPIISRDGLDYGFLYCPSQPEYGKMITTSDQDWVRLNKNKQLMQEMLHFLNRYQAMVTPPQILIDASVDRPCNGESIEFTTQLTDTSGFETFQWLVNGQPVLGATGKSWNFNNYQDGDVVECQLSLDYGCGIYEKVSNQFLVDPATSLFANLPVINPHVNSICDGQAARFWAQVDLRNGIYNPRYQWLFNGNPIPNGTSINLTINSFSATDSVQFIMTYDNNCQNDIQLFSETTTLSVIELVTPEINLETDRSVICENETVTFTVTGTNLGNNPTYFWSIDGQSISNPGNTFITSNLTDDQEVSVQVIPAVDCPSAAIFTPDPIIIEVNPIVIPEISVQRLGDEICEGDVYSFAASIKNGGDAPKVEWMINGQPTGATGMTFTTNTLLDGQTVEALLISTATCVTTDHVYSNVIDMELQSLEEPELRLFRSQSVVCPGEASTFEAIGIHLGNEPRYRWFVDGEAIAADTAVFSQVLEPGQTVSCQAISSRTCVLTELAESNILESSINDLSVSLGALAPASCNNNNGYAEIIANGGMPPYRYEWNNGMASTRIDNLASGNYQVTVTDVIGCQVEMAVLIEGETMPALNELYIEHPDCFRSQGSATARIENNERFSYEWYNEADEMISENFYAFDLAPGEYELIVSTPQGCTSSYAFEILTADQLQVQLPNKIITKEGDKIEITPVIAPTRNELTYTWFPAEGLSCTDCPNPILDPQATTTYTLIVEMANGCSSSSEILVEVTPNLDCYIPNIFSPNGDGQNDFFTAFGGAQTEEIIRLQVYDRWGNEAFGGENLPLGVEQMGWNGTLKGKKLPSGVYLYSVEVRFKSGRIEQFTGDVTLVR